MAQFYILSPKGVIFELDATTDMTYTESGKTTDSPIESGESVSDHYIQKPSVTNFSGVITDISSYASNVNEKLSTREYINGLRTLKNSKRPFKIYISNNFAPLSNCVFTSLTIKNNKEFGVTEFGERVAGSYQVDFSVKQIRLAAAATEIIGVPQPDLQDMTKPKVESSQTTERFPSIRTLGRVVILER